MLLFFLAPCGSRSTGSEGTVLSPNYPKNYSVGHNCVFSVAVPKEFGEYITSVIEVDTMSMELY